MAWSVFTSTGGSAARPGSPNIAARPGEQLVLPRRHLGGVDIEAFGRLGRGAFLPQRSERHFGFESRGMGATGSTGQRAPVLEGK